MSSVTPVVLDASVGVKWFREEHGSVQARELLHQHAEGTLALHVAEHFVTELLAVVHRQFSVKEIIPAWEAIALAQIEIHPLSDELVGEAARQCALLGCTFYDALAPALAVLLGGELVSADRRAHSRFADARFIESR